MAVDHKITLLGPIPYDSITTTENEVFERFGCLTYPTIALSKLFGKTTRITPVSHVRARDQQGIKSILKGHPGVELLRITADLDMGDVIIVQFINTYKCVEKQYGFMDPIMPRDVKYLLDSDYFVCMPVTDYEISLETLHFIKEYSKGKIIFDAHGPTTAMTSLGDRVTKFWVDRDLWLPYIDILTMTLEQAKCIWYEKEYTLEQLESSEDLDDAALSALAEHCFHYGVKAVYITLGKNGCFVYSRRDEAIQKQYILPVKLRGEANDTTGRGESFLAGLVYGLLTTHGDYMRAARFGNAVSAQRVRGMNYDVFDSVGETIKLVEDTYGLD